VIVVVGGQCRNVGKTTVICEVIHRFPSLGWTALKISRHSHRRHRIESPKNDTARYLAAGAIEARLLRGPTAAETLEFLAPLIESGRPVIIESNSVLETLRPDFYVLVVDSRQEDVKDSARRFAGAADAVVSSFATGAPAFCEGRTLISVSDMLEMLGRRIIERHQKSA